MSQQPAVQIDHAPEIHAVHRIELHHFRNHLHASLEPEGKSVVLYGHNGAGKTNILEALSLLSPGRGFRRAKLAEMDYRCHSADRGSERAESRSCSPHEVRQQDDVQAWVISAEVVGKIGEVQVGTGREANKFPPLAGGFRGEASSIDSPPRPPVNGGDNIADRRVVRANGAPLKSHNQLSEYLSVLWLTPQMDMLFLEGGTIRRKFLDRLVYGFDAAHASRVSRYEQAMRERNRLLSKIFPPLAGGNQRRGIYDDDLSHPRPPLTPPVNGGGKNMDDWLTSLENQMAEHGAAIAFARAQAIAHINAVMQISTLNFPKAQLALKGSIENLVAENATSADVETHFKKLLLASRGEDASAGRTLIGVHRAEFTVMHLQKHMEAALCSTGEQKALLLAIILAEARSCSLWHSHVPILLLDEVAAHLDPQKRLDLYKEIQDLRAQVWMSGVSSDLFEEMHDNSVFFRVEQGHIFKE